MGRHSDPQQKSGSLVDTAFRALTVPASQSKTSQGAAGILSSVRRRPRLAVLLVPVAAGAAIVASATMVAAGGGGEQVVSQSEQSDSGSAQDYTASEALAVDDAEQDLNSFVSGSGGVSAEGAPAAQKDRSSHSGDSGSDRGSSDESSSGKGGDSSGSVSSEPCSTSASIESGLTQNAIEAYRAVCAEFPQVSSYGGRRAEAGSDHNTGQAVDAMIRGSVGDDITAFLIEHRSELSIKYIIWEQKIYASYTGWKGRPMEDRGSDTANHFDHVHISVN